MKMHEFDWSKLPNIKTKRRANRTEHSAVVGPWSIAETILNLALEPLHLVTRLTVHTVTYVLVEIISYHKLLSTFTERIRLIIIKRNHRYEDPSAFRVLTVKEFEYHLKHCCHIYFKFNETGNSSGSGMDYNSQTRRFMLRHFKRLFFCERCSYRPLEGSPLESLFIRMMQQLAHCLYPYEILTWDMYKEFYDKDIFGENLKNIRLRSAEYTLLFEKLCGVKHLTRYIWQNSDNAFYYMDLSYKFNLSYRSLWGCDSEESSNERVCYIVTFHYT